MLERAAKISITTLVILGVILVFDMDYQEQQMLPDCDLIKLWEQQREQGIEPYSRLGRPAANQYEREQCLGE